MRKTSVITFITILLTCLLLHASHAQLETQWVSHFDHGNRGENESFWDIFATIDGGFALCGDSYSNGRNDIWVVKISNQGNLVWSRIFGNPGHDHAASLIQDDDGGYVVVGSFRDDDQTPSDIAVLRTDAQGNTLWSRRISSDRTDFADAVIELKSGEFMVCGAYYNAQNNSQDGCLLQLDRNGELLWMETYGDGGSQSLVAMRETEGGIIACGKSSGNHYIIKTDFEGELIWDQIYNPGANNYIMETGMTSCRTGGFVLTGRYWINHDISCAYLLRIDDDGNQLWTRQYQIDAGNPPYGNCGAYNVVEQADGGLIMSCNGTGGHDALLIRTDGQGNEVWRSSENFGEGNYNCRFRALVIDGNGQITAAGSAEYNQTDVDGLVVSFLTEDISPLILSYSPEELELQVLLGEEIDFIVHAEPLVEADVLYLWTLDEDSVGSDTSYSMNFDALEQRTLKCVVTNGGFVDSVAWHITVDYFFIASTSPDSLRLLTRRGIILPFTLDVACVEPDAPTVEWTVVNRDNDSEYLGEADTVEVCFDLAGDWAVEAEASWNGERESVRWAIDVRSAVWWWMPQEDAISINRNERRDFSVFPFDPDSDSLSINWWLDGNSLESNAEVLSLDFPDCGDHSLVSIVRDGIEADTIRWAITVNESGVGIDQNGIPTELVLHSPAPNPFNSTTTIGYSLPIAGNVSLIVYDLFGREVARLVDGVKVAGNHQVSWTAKGVASGVYVVALNAGGMMLREKVALVK